MKYAILVKNEPENYDIRAEIMWACKLAHDETAGFGRKQDWASHNIAHELGAKYDIMHGAAMGVISLAWMKYVFIKNSNRFIQLANRIFDIDTDLVSNKKAITLAIGMFEQFLVDIGMPVTLREMGIHDKMYFREIGKNCVKSMESGTIGNFVRLSPKDIENILEAAY